MTSEISQAIVSSVLVQFGERREVENQLDERIDRAAGFEHGHAEVDQFGGALAENLDTEQLPVVRAENQFQQSRGIADNLPSRIVGIFRATHYAGNFLFPAGFLVLAHSGNFRNRINSHGELRSEPLLVRKAKRM